MKSLHVIDGDKTSLSLGIQDIYNYRELLLILAYRDFRVKYAQTILGLLWGFIQPLLTLIIFTVVFSKGLKVATEGIPYPVFALAGLSSWAYFSQILSTAGTSVITAGNIIKKIYFPRLIIPLSKSIVAFVEFGITLLFLIVLMVYYQFVPSPNIVWLPAFIVLTIIAGLTAGVWLSALSIRYRDFQQVIPFMVRLGLYVTPVAYPANIIPEKYLSIYYILNPMAGIVEGFRWSITGYGAMNTYAYISFGILIVLFIGGLFYFRKVEKVMADIV